jgi:hypothetical protein
MPFRSAVGLACGQPHGGQGFLTSNTATLSRLRHAKGHHASEDGKNPRACLRKDETMVISCLGSTGDREPSLSGKIPSGQGAQLHSTMRLKGVETGAILR